jgi:hypothetical protein
LAPAANIAPQAETIKAGVRERFQTLDRIATLSIYVGSVWQ